MKERMLRIAKRIFFLPPVLTMVIAIPSFVLVIVALTGGIDNPVLVYVSYVLSAYALIITVTGITKIVSFIRGGFRENALVKTMLSVPVIGKLVSESTFRTEMALYPGFCINAVYVIFKTATGIYYRSAWFISLGVYYLALAIMRMLLIHYIRVKKGNGGKTDELKRYRACGYMLFLINAALVGITILAVKKNAGFTYPGYLIYVMAMYAFYSVVIAVINLVKYRKYGSPVMSAAKVVNMSTALVSMFSLETAMLEQFGGNNTESFRLIMVSLTGAGISFIVIGMALYMIIHSSILIKAGADD